MFMLRNTLQSLPINLKLKKLNGSLNIPCRVCFYLCKRTPCHWGGFLCRPIQHSLLSPHHELPFYIFSCEFSEYSSGETDTNTGCIYYSAPSTMRGVSRDFDFADSRNREAQLQWNAIDFKHWFCFGELIQSPWTLELCIEEHLCCLPVRSQFPQPALESWDLRKWQQQVVLGSSRKWGGGLPLLPTWVTLLLITSHTSHTLILNTSHTPRVTDWILLLTQVLPIMGHMATQLLTKVPSCVVVSLLSQPGCWDNIHRIGLKTIRPQVKLHWK